MVTAVQLDDFKARQRAMWEAGEYADLSPYIADVGDLVVTKAGIEPGMKVLDVACGTGNAARAAARLGAQVTGLDLTPKLLKAGQARAAVERLSIDWREGDAEDLPFDNASFDRVLSTFGHMFAPRHQRTADEMARVCRRGGMIVTATWTPEGTVGAIFETSSSFMPPPPHYASPPIEWGNDDHVRHLFSRTAVAFHFERHLNQIQWNSLENWTEYFMDRFGPMVTARAILGDRFVNLRDRVVEIWKNANLDRHGRLLLPQEYLLSIVQL